MRELDMVEVELVSGGGGDQPSSSPAPWWSVYDHNGDGDLYDEARNYFTGATVAFGALSVGAFAASGGVGTPVAAGAGAAALTTGAIAGGFDLADRYFGNEAAEEAEDPSSSTE